MKITFPFLPPITETAYFIPPDMASVLRQEHGITDKDLVGMNVRVDPGIPAGQAFCIPPTYKHPPPQPEWLKRWGLSVVRRDMPIIVTNIT